MHLISKFQWNPETVHLGEVKYDAFEKSYIASKCKDLGDRKKGDYHYRDPKTYESILQSINSVLVDLGSKMKRRIFRIATPAVSDK